MNGVDGSFIIDTGDRSSLTLFRHFAQANNCYRDAPVRNVVARCRHGSTEYLQRRDANDRLALWNHDFRRVVRTSRGTAEEACAVGTDDASVGQGLLKRFNIVYDYPDRTIFAWPSRFFHNADRYVPLAFDHGVLRAGQPGSDPTILPTPSPRLPRHAVFGARVAQSAGVVRASFVVAGSPAAQAGLLAGDVIRAIGGMPTATVAAFLVAVHDLRANEGVSVDVVRNGKPLRLFPQCWRGAPDERDRGVVTEYGAIDVDDSERRTLLTLRPPPRRRPRRCYSSAASAATPSTWRRARETPTCV